MAVTTQETVDVAGALGTMLGGIDGLRVYTYVADNFRPPGVILALPEIDYTDGGAGFCRATWTFPATIIVSRNNDRAAQEALSQWVSAVALALSVTPPDGVFEVTPQVARPTTVQVSGVEMPAYTLTVLARA